MSKKIDLSDVRVGDTLFHTQYDYHVVSGIKKTGHSEYPVLIEFKDLVSHRSNGTCYSQGIPSHPTLFHSKMEAVEYFLSTINNEYRLSRDNANA